MEAPTRRQRIGAYADVRRVRDGAEQILLTRMSSAATVAGRWTLPGGGVDHGEDPWRTVVREVREETGLDVVPVRVLDITSTHFVGRNHRGVDEDFHGIHLIFEGQLQPSSEGVEPVVLERDSSTDLAAWVDLDEARVLPLLTAAAHVLGVPRG